MKFSVGMLLSLSWSKNNLRSKYLQQDKEQGISRSWHATLKQLLVATEMLSPPIRPVKCRYTPYPIKGQSCVPKLTIFKGFARLAG